MKVIGTIEARMGSSRLPGKTLMKVYNDVTLLECVVRRFQMCGKVDEVIVATSVSSLDDEIALWCEQNAVNYSRGSEEDVLDRVVKAFKTCGADAVVQMGADSAYLDYQLIDYLVDLYLSGQYDYVCNDLKLSYPIGIYGHVVNARVLESLNEQTDLSAEDREDVVRCIFENPDKYTILNIEADQEYAHPQLRFTVDYPEDLAQARAIYNHFQGYTFTTTELIDLYKRQPEMFEKTQGLVQHSAAFIKKGNV